MLDYLKKVLKLVKPYRFRFGLGVFCGFMSGVLHLAMALGVPTLALFRDYAGTLEWLPRGQAHKHLLAPCPCANAKNPPCAKENKALCLTRITPERVLAVMGELLNGA
jgi:ADP-heptose:LPS heptosyltransferase